MEFLGIPLAIDIGTALSVLGIGGIYEAVRRQMRKKDETDRLKVEAKLQQNRERKEKAEEAYQTYKEALQIHESLTSLEVLEVLDRAQAAEEDPIAKSFLVATYRRGNRRYGAFKDSVELPDELEELVREALGPIPALYPEELEPEHQRFKKQQQKRQNDNSKYVWAGAGPHPKIWAVNLIAQQWAKEKHISTRAEFEESFGAELKKAAPSRAGEFDPNVLLTTTTDGKYRPTDKYLAGGLLLTLDGIEYGIHNRCGFKERAVGAEVQKPIIEYFRDEHGYPVSEA